jgi:ribulose 1,5-bisphosphate synthetase/thiazole synthase
MALSWSKVDVADTVYRNAVSETTYDVIVAGSGAAGLAAAVISARRTEGACSGKKRPDWRHQRDVGAGTWVPAIIMQPRRNCRQQG